MHLFVSIVFYAAVLIGRITGFVRPSVCLSVGPVLALTPEQKAYKKNYNYCERFTGQR